MASQARTYNDAIDALNTLQSSFAVIEARKKAGIRPDANSIKEMRVYLSRIGYSPSDLDRLNIIHVAGTKGKGSTCAFADAILNRYQRARGVPRKVGLFVSPHLIAVRERVRIGSQPIGEELFAKYFFEVWDRLESSAAGGEEVAPGSKPIYARFLTLMSWHVFLQESVEVAIYETGIGGEFDATNIVEQPAAAGISTLGIDHTFVLGETIDKIAWHKAGIMKPGSPAFTVEQKPEAAEVLKTRAAEKGVDLKVLKVDPRLAGVAIRPNALFQKKNASLAIALAETALSKIDPTFQPNPTSLPKEFVDGLENVVWRGRCEIKDEEKIRWHLDGAHTDDSIAVAARWFSEEVGDNPGPKVLIFNQQSRTAAVDFIRAIFDATGSEGKPYFKHAIFCTNVTYAAAGYKKDLVNNLVNREEVEKLTLQRQFAEVWSSWDPSAEVSALPSIEDAINRVHAISQEVRAGQKVQAFIVGSLHLVGGALSILEGADAL